MSQVSSELLQSLIDDVSTLVRSLLPDSFLLIKLGELRDDILADYTTIVVVGEFKHGKSTLMNALLGQAIMPADVTPTTATINVVFHSEQSEVRVVKTSGTEEDYPLTAEVLERYTASSSFRVDDIRYIKVFCPAPLLENRVVLVDTPGVNDLNTHRAEITHLFIPRADVIIYMLSLTQPVKRTEQEFLQNVLLPQGTEQIIYVANFADCVDEEELEETLAFVKQRITKITGQENPSVIAVSALEALRGKVTGEDHRLRSSGLPELESAIVGLLEDGTRKRQKLANYKRRFKLLLEEAMSELEAAEQLSHEQVEVLQGQLQVIEGWYEHKAQWEKQIQDYVNEQEMQIQYMAQKSFAYFSEKLHVEAEQRVLHFRGADIKQLTESQLPMFIRSQVSQWMDQYGYAIHHLFSKLEQGVTRGLSGLFQESVQIRVYQPGELALDTSQPILAETGHNPHVKAGLLVGGASAAALLLGGTFLIPLIGMAGLPLIQQKVAEKHLEHAKPMLLSAVNEHLDGLYRQGMTMLQTYISTSVNHIREKTLLEFMQLLNSRKNSVDKEIRLRTSHKNDEQQFQSLLQAANMRLADYIQKL